MVLRQKTIRQWHRYLGLVFSLSVLLSSGSGILHSVMSRTQPPPPAARPGGLIDPKDIHISVADAVKKIGQVDAHLQAVSIRSISGIPWYQFFLEGEKKIVYVNALDGTLNYSQDATYAAQIASDYLGGQKVRQTNFLTAFNDEYINIFRILPVYRFDVDDARGTRVYVSTMTGSVTRATDNHKQWEANVFSNFHKFQFIKNKDLRDTVLTLMTLGVFVAGVSGIILFFLSRPGGRSI